MKKTVSILAAAIITIALTGCEQFSTSYQRIDDSEFRMLKYIWEPADAAPGDTITLTAVFAGKRMDLSDDDVLEWRVSFNVIRDLLGNTTVVNSQKLRPIAISMNPDFAFSPNTQAIQFKFRVPPDIVKTSASIPERLSDALPPQIMAALPAELASVLDSMTKTQIVGMIESAAENANTAGLGFNESLIPILQYFTVPMRVFTKEPGREPYPHTITSTQNIRYNSRFKNTPGLVNHNPVVDRVVVYKVRGGDVGNIDNKNGLTLDSVVLDNSGNSVIDVESGYSYFLDAIARPIDTTYILDVNGRPQKRPERHRVYRQFQLDKNETAGVNRSKLMDINNFNGKITMPSDHKIKNFIFWLTVYDELEGERLRPNGGTLVEVSGRLNYK
ncbi:hypothetical protein R80B4_00496 [Fibrobacteres bacterium R8-0-B4]